MAGLFEAADLAGLAFAGVALTGLLDVDFAGVAFDGLFEADLAGVAGLLDELFAGVVAGVFLDALNKSDRLFLSDAGVLFLTGLFDADRAGVSVLAGCQPTGMVTNTQVCSLIFFHNQRFIETRGRDT